MKGLLYSTTCVKKNSFNAITNIFQNWANNINLNDFPLFRSMNNYVFLRKFYGKLYINKCKFYFVVGVLHRSWQIIFYLYRQLIITYDVCSDLWNWHVNIIYFLNWFHIVLNPKIHNHITYISWTSFFYNRSNLSSFFLQ